MTRNIPTTIAEALQVDILPCRKDSGREGRVSAIEIAKINMVYCKNSIPLTFKSLLCHGANMALSVGQHIKNYREESI